MAIPERISTQETMISGPSRFARVGECATDRLSDKRATSNRRQPKGFCLDPCKGLAELVLFDEGQRHRTALARYAPVWLTGVVCCDRRWPRFARRDQHSDRAAPLTPGLMPPTISAHRINDGPRG
jgi:hypothetical protein